VIPFSVSIRALRSTTPLALSQKCHVAALLVLDEVGGEHVTFRAPWPKQDTELVETRLPRLCPKLPDGQQARVAAGLDDEVRLALVGGLR
jgi:hypothetical protein